MNTATGGDAATSTPIERIGFIGLGTMGGPMAAHLTDRFSVVVYNRTCSRTEAVARAGAEVAASPADVAKKVDAIVLCVSDTPDVEAMLFGPDGAIEGLPSGALVIDCSTISPEATRSMAARLAEKGVGFVDAPVSGGSEGAENATLAIMCGGTVEDVERARPVLAAMGKTITHVGPVGAGQVAKAVNQVVIAGTYLAVAEGMVLASKAGVDPRRVKEAIAGGAAASWVLDNRADNMIEDGYPLGFRLALHRKDLGIALDSARAAGCALPNAAFVATVEDGLIAQGHGDEDMSAIARAVRRGSGVPDGPLAE